MPAPMMTTRGVEDMALLLTTGCGGELEGRVEQPVGGVAGEGGPDEDDVVVAAVGEGQQHDAGPAERGLRAASPAEHPWVQVDRAALGQDVPPTGTGQPEADPLRGDVR